MNCKFVIFLFEDVLSEAVLKVILEKTKPQLLDGTFICGKGYGNIKRKLKNYNQASKNGCILILTDLDNFECPPALIDNWADGSKLNKNLIFCVAIKEVEAWLLASRQTFSDFIGVGLNKIPQNVEDIVDPKSSLFNLVKKSPRRDLRDDILPVPKSGAKIGKGYNHALTKYVTNYWDIEEAQKYSPSLSRAIKKIASISFSS